MADKPVKTITSKRTVKNPESFRERAIKATNESDKPKQSAEIKRAINLKLDPVRNSGKTFANYPIFNPIRRPLRLIGKVIIPVYLRNSWKELKLVTWPSWKQSVRLTYAVLFFAIIFGVSVAVIDLGLDVVFKKILLK
jgi:preprotein translocase SecE subunit